MKKENKDKSHSNDGNEYVEPNDDTKSEADNDDSEEMTTDKVAYVENKLINSYDESTSESSAKLPSKSLEGPRKLPLNVVDKHRPWKMV